MIPLNRPHSIFSDWQIHQNKFYSLSFRWLIELFWEKENPLFQISQKYVKESKLYNLALYITFLLCICQESNFMQSQFSQKYVQLYKSGFIA